MTDLSTALERLNTKVATAGRKAREVRQKTRTPEAAGADLLRPLAGYHREVKYRRRHVDRQEEARLVDELLAAVQTEGVSLVPADPHVPAKGLRVVDHREQLELARAEAAANEVRGERDRFLGEHGAELAAEESRAEMDRIRDALRGDDPEALRRELSSVA